LATLHLVTGGAGFIGSHITSALLNKGEKVRIIDDFSTGKRENISSFLSEIEIFEGSLLDYDFLLRATRGVNVIYHQGAIPSVPRSIMDPVLSNHVNIGGTVNLLQAAVKNSVSRFVYAASSSAYGNTEQLPKRETMDANPLSPYAISKYTGELYCKIFYDIYGLETISLRYFNVFGPRQNPYSEYSAVIPKFISLMLNNNRPIIYGDGSQSRDFTYIDNVVLANLLAATSPNLNGEVINIGTGNMIALNQLVCKINTILDKKIEPIYSKERIGDVKESLADIEKATKLIGYKPIVSFNEGLERTIRWFQSKECEQYRNVIKLKNNKV